MITIDQIRNRLSAVPEEHPPEDGLAPTAVALLLRMESGGPSVFFIERAHDKRDPWAGNIGFPGGRMGSEDPDLKHTAERETMEEVGVSLAAAELLGRLPDIVGANLPVRVACFVYVLESPVPVTLNVEVNDAFWIPLPLLADPERHLTAQVSFNGDILEAPAIRLPHPEKQVLWGITYRLIQHFMTIVSAEQMNFSQGGHYET